MAGGVVKKTSKEVKALMVERKAWAESKIKCWICGVSTYAGFPLETHEMERKSHAPNHSWAAKENYFCACKRCHMDDLAAMPHAKQLAYKYIRDVENYDLEAWLRVKDPSLRAPNRVTEDEVMDAVKEIVLKQEIVW